MSRIRSQDMAPEMYVRRLVYGLGYRYRLHRKDLPGKPDLVFPGRRKVIFVHGCFWHQHAGCKGGHIPKSNQDYWIPKLERNKARDKKVKEELRSKGWDVLVIWECELKEHDSVVERIKKFLTNNLPQSWIKKEQNK